MASRKTGFETPGARVATDSILPHGRPEGTRGPPVTNEHTQFEEQSIRSGSSLRAESEAYNAASYHESRASGSPRISVHIHHETERLSQLGVPMPMPRPAPLPAATSIHHSDSSWASRPRERRRSSRVNLPAQIDLDPELNVADPRDWLVRHHRDGIIQRLTMPKASLWWKPLVWAFDIESASQSSSYEHLRVSFAEMQRMHLRKLQIKLVKHAVEMRSSGKEPDDWHCDLAQYIQGIKDHDYMLECSQRPRDVFIATAERVVDRFVISKVVGDHFVYSGRTPFHDDMGTIPISETWELDDETEPIPGTRSSVANQSFWNRVKMAAMGGIFLIGPMWLMVLFNWRYMGLITTTVCVVVFGLSMSAALDKPMDVLSSTAAYAAVLVVFVGVSTT